MPESENRPIERLLRQAAARRRAQVGSPEMHPATREMLLTEVRRHHGGGGAPAQRPWWWRLTPALAAVAVVALGSWVLLRDSADEPVELAKSQSDTALRKSGLPAPLPAANEPLSFAEADRQPQPTEEHAAPEPKALVASVRTADSSPRAASPESHAELAKADALHDRPAAGPPAAAQSSLAGSATTPLQVLRNFVVLQTGSRVRFIDADGSTYEGELAPASVRQDAAPLLGLAREATQPSAPAAKQASAPAGQASSVSYDFAAEGLNQSLQQQVRFVGNLVLTEDQLLQTRNSFSNTLPPELQQLPQGTAHEGQAMPLGRVQGAFQLGDGSSLRVDAVPTPSPR